MNRSSKQFKKFKQLPLLCTLRVASSFGLNVKNVYTVYKLRYVLSKTCFLLSVV